MGWLASNNLLSVVIERYRASKIAPLESVFWYLDQTKRPLVTEKEALAVILACEAFAAISDQPSSEFDMATVGPRAFLYQRTLWNVALLVLQSLRILKQSSFFREEWRDDFSDLESRLKKISVGYEEHRQHPNRGVKTDNERTGEWENAEPK